MTDAKLVRKTAVMRKTMGGKADEIQIENHEKPVEDQKPKRVMKKTGVASNEKKPDEGKKRKVG